MHLKLNNPLSSNGRTPAFEAVNVGSTPAGGAVNKGDFMKDDPNIKLKAQIAEEVQLAKEQRGFAATARQANEFKFAASLEKRAAETDKRIKKLRSKLV